MLGAHNVRLTAAEEPNRVEYRSEVYTIHPNWGPNLLRNDMALIKLPESVTFTGTYTYIFNTFILGDKIEFVIFK